MADPNQVKKWRQAHPGIDVDADALATMAPFPSLFANDFLAYIDSKGHAQEIVHFVRDLHRELVWTYSCWEKAQRDSKAELLIADMLNNARHGAEYEFTHKFLRDYAKANNIAVQTTDAEPSWLDIMPAGTSQQLQANAQVAEPPPALPAS